MATDCVEGVPTNILQAQTFAYAPTCLRNVSPTVGVDGSAGCPREKRAIQAVIGWSDGRDVFVHIGTGHGEEHHWVPGLWTSLHAKLVPGCVTNHYDTFR